VSFFFSFSFFFPASSTFCLHHSTFFLFSKEQRSEELFSPQPCNQRTLHASISTHTDLCLFECNTREHLPISLLHPPIDVKIESFLLWHSSSPPWIPCHKAKPGERNTQYPRLNHGIGTPCSPIMACVVANVLCHASTRGILFCCCVTLFL
jgi:hypothetical protein